MSDPAPRGPAGDLAGHVVIVTGAGQGIGRAIALRCAEKGASVVLAARTRANLERVAAEVERLGAPAFVVPTDLREQESVDAMAREAMAAFGQIDALVCNSGIAGPTAELWNLGLPDWEETFRVNVTGTFLSCRACLPPMLERGSGSVVVIGSMSGKRPLYGRTAYTASKMALVGLVRTLATEAGPHGVRVNLISPGGTDGPRIQRVLEAQAQSRGITVEQAREEMTAPAALGRLTLPAEVADAAVFLASSASSAVTGEDLNVSAGLVMY